MHLPVLFGASPGAAKEGSPNSMRYLGSYDEIVSPMTPSVSVHQMLFKDLSHALTKHYSRIE